MICGLEAWKKLEGSERVGTRGGLTDNRKPSLALCLRSLVSQHNMHSEIQEAYPITLSSSFPLLIDGTAQRPKKYQSSFDHTL